MPRPHHHLVPRPDPALLSFVIPFYDEQEGIPHLRRRMETFLETLPCRAEIVCVNDGSADRTLEALLDWAREDARVRVLGLARNFGHQAAVTAGLDVADGDAVVIMDADLQDPPEVVHDMLARYREGYDVVFGRRTSREGESALKRVTAWGFYRFMKVFIHHDLPPDAGDFRLMSRRCLEALKSMRETHRFLRGMVAWVGFPQIDVPYARHARSVGTTKYPLAKMLRFACTAALSFSAVPLRISMAFGVLVGLFGLALGGWALVTAIIGDNAVRGWTSLIVTICLVGGGILISIGILGEYIGRMFEELKDRPLYIVSTRANFAEPAAETHTADGEAPVALLAPTHHRLPQRPAVRREVAGHS